ncbi:MAG: hypothetical protein IJT43_08810 [Stomatobaculum sp.]|nr:hypothetical protein [Stomatobaculum sp.]
MKLMKTAAAAAVLCLLTTQPVLAVTGWQSVKEPGKVTTFYELEDGTKAKDGWYWLDDDGDGISECFYFDENGALLVSGTAKDGALTDEKGRWILEGKVQIQGGAADTISDGAGNYTTRLDGFRNTAVLREVSDAEIDAFYADSVMVGDSVMLGFRNYTMRTSDPFLKSIGILCAGSFSVHESFDPVSSSSVHPIYQGAQRPVWESIAMMSRKHVFLFFGLNDIALDDSTPQLYQKLVANIKAAYPEAQINIISMTYTAAGAGKKRLNNDNIRKFNAEMKKMAAENGWGFVDMANPLSDGSGNLAPAYCSDKYVHQTPAAYQVWVQVLRQFAREILQYTEAE